MLGRTRVQRCTGLRVPLLAVLPLLPVLVPSGRESDACGRTVTGLQCGFITQSALLSPSDTHTVKIGLMFLQVLARLILDLCAWLCFLMGRVYRIALLAFMCWFKIPGFKRA